MLMRRLYPEPAPNVDVADAYTVRTGAGRHLRVNMVSSADGAATVDRRVGALSGPADQELLHLLRGLCDVLLVGAGTVRAEGYGPLDLPEEARRRRTESGQLPVPRMAILTREITLDLDAPVFTSATDRPVVLTTERAPVERRTAAAEVADVVVVGEQQVDLPRALDALVERGLSRILSEGGPQVLAELLAAGLVDELCLAIAPLVTCGAETRITAGPALATPMQLTLAQVLEQDEFLFLRYTR